MTATTRPATFSVLLARPDSIANDNLDTLYTVVNASNPHIAVAVARLEACEADDYDPDDAEDYAVLLCIAGSHQDINPEV